MRKIIFTVCCMLLFAVGCSGQAATESPVSPSPSVESLVGLNRIGEKEISRLTVYKSEAHGIIGSTLVKQLSSSGEQATVLKALRTASLIPGILDTATPDYDFVFLLKNGERIAFHFWLSAESGQKGMVVNVKDTGTGYSLTKDSTQTLLKLVTTAGPG